MIRIKNKYIPTKGYAALFFFGFLFVRQDAVITERILRHERIHARQCVEMLGVFFYLWYVIEWGIRLIQYQDRDKAYRNISFEREAYNNQSNTDYLKQRKFYHWIRYITEKGL